MKHFGKTFQVLRFRPQKTFFCWFRIWLQCRSLWSIGSYLKPSYDWKTDFLQPTQFWKKLRWGSPGEHSLIARPWSKRFYMKSLLKLTVRSANVISTIVPYDWNPILGFYHFVLLEVLPVEIFDMTWWIRIRDVIKTKKTFEKSKRSKMWRCHCITTVRLWWIISYNLYHCRLWTESLQWLTVTV